jgi:hypothetical protein
MDLGLRQGGKSLFNPLAFLSLLHLRYGMVQGDVRYSHGGIGYAVRSACVYGPAWDGVLSAVPAGQQVRLQNARRHKLDVLGIGRPYCCHACCPYAQLLDTLTHTHTYTHTLTHTRTHTHTHMRACMH